MGDYTGRQNNRTENQRQDTMNIRDEADALRRRIAELEAECISLRYENTQLRKNSPEVKTEPAKKLESQNTSSNNSDTGAIVTQSSTTKEKIQLFRSLFQGRQDVYPIRWVNKNGRAGYSPACANEWDRRFCNKPRIKCSECPNRKLLPLTDRVIHSHLAGGKTIGVYPLLEDESCHFVAADFDKKDWQKDVLSFLETCDEMGIHAALERSRSGNGAHVWMFFDEALPATAARKLAAAILTSTMQRRPEIGFESYDRLFPNQDTMPKGGFGNLIALPLQGEPRKTGNALFIDRTLQPFPDQWQYLSGISRNTREIIDRTIRKVERQGDVTGVNREAALLDEDDEEPWMLPPSEKKPIAENFGQLPKSVKIVHSNMVFVEKAGLPPAFINRLIRLAAFQNPEFYKAQAMRLPTFNKPRIISCANGFKQYIGLPRGYIYQVLALLKEHKIEPVLHEERCIGESIEPSFHGKLRPRQNAAFDALKVHDTGLLCAAVQSQDLPQHLPSRPEILCPANVFV